MGESQRVVAVGDFGEVRTSAFLASFKFLNICAHGNYLLGLRKDECIPPFIYLFAYLPDQTERALRIGEVRCDAFIARQQMHTPLD